MSYLPCIVCGALTKSTRCGECQHAYRRGYGAQHRREREDAIKHHPWCSICGHRRCDLPGCSKCPLQLDHVDPIRGGRTPDTGRRQVLCAVCNRLKSDR